MRVKIFFCYARKDRALRDELAKHLEPLRRTGHIITWYDREIDPGREWRNEIDKQLNSSAIILLLISSNFINSDFCYGVELKRAMELHKLGESLVIPIILRPVNWKDTPIGELQALPTDGKPVTRWRNRDEAFQDVAERLSPVVKKIRIIQYFLEAKRLNEISQYDNAIAIYEQIIDFTPYFIVAYIGKGECLWQLKRYEEALAAYNQAISIWSLRTDFDRHFWVSPQDRRSWMPDTVQAKIRGGHRSDKEDYLYLLKAKVLVALNRNEEALAAYDQAIRLALQPVYAYHYKADTLRDLKRYEEALAIYDHAIAIYDSSDFIDHGEYLVHKDAEDEAEIYNSKGFVLEQLKRSEEALRAYDTAREIQRKPLVESEEPLWMFFGREN